MTVFACCECWKTPRAGCMYENHSTAFPHAKMENLGCPRGRKPNWVYLDMPDRREIRPKMPTIGQIRYCYSQRDLKEGLTIAQFYEQQGRIYESGEWVFPHTSTPKTGAEP